MKRITLMLVAVMCSSLSGCAQTNTQDRIMLAETRSMAVQARDLAAQAAHDAAVAKQAAYEAQRVSRQAEQAAMAAATETERARRMAAYSPHIK